MTDQRCVTCGADEDRCLDLTLADEDGAPGACCGACDHQPLWGRKQAPTKGERMYPLRLDDLPPWVGTLLAAVIDQADNTDCNRDHEGEDGCDACAWDGVLRQVPNRLVAEVYQNKEQARG